MPVVMPWQEEILNRMRGQIADAYDQDRDLLTPDIRPRRRRHLGSYHQRLAFLAREIVLERGGQ